MGTKFNHLCGEIATEFQSASFLPFLNEDQRVVQWNSVDHVSQGITSSITAPTVRTIIKEFMDEGVVPPSAVSEGFDGIGNYEQLLRHMIAHTAAETLRLDPAVCQEEAERHTSYLRFMGVLENRPSSLQVSSPTLRTAPASIIPADVDSNGHVPERQRLD